MPNFTGEQKFWFEKCLTNEKSHEYTELKLPSMLHHALGLAIHGNLCATIDHVHTGIKQLAEVENVRSELNRAVYKLFDKVKH